MKIKDIPAIDRPREKMARYGPEKLTNSELLAILFGSGTRGENVVKLSNSILKKYSFEKLSSLALNELKTMSGIGTAKASTLLACFELGRRTFLKKQSTLVLTPKDVWRDLRDIIDNKKEHFVIFFLDVRNQIIKKETIAVGTLTSAIVHPREVFEPAIKYHTAQIILAHNHPSGISEPSEEDRILTVRLVSAGKLLGIEIVDHVIVVKSGWYSFADNSIL